MLTITDATNNLYDIYIKSIVDLARSICIKFDQVAQATNLQVIQSTGTIPDANDRTTWKYYQNISGQYHFSDTMMSIYSLDSETTIDFTKANLLANPVTANAYSYGSSYYNELLTAYPKQEMLILGILYPVDINYAIAAKDGTILNYPSFLVESTELDFISLLQKWIYAYINRWVVMAFTLTDDLYSAAYLAQLYLHLIPAITNIRLVTCKTNQAHSFHIKQFLRSHGFLDIYLNELTHKQALNMYRNINYYERNAGFESTFNQLVDILMTQVQLPVYEYEMFHNVEALSRNSISDDRYLQPTALFKRKPINSIAKRYPLSDYNLTEVISVLDSATPNNADYQDHNKTEIEAAFSTSSNAQLPTKIIECSLNPVSVPSQQTPDGVLFNHWITLVANDKYAVPVEYSPQGSKNAVRFTHQQALAMWIYATQMALSPEIPPPGYHYLQRVPLIKASRVVRDPLVNKSVLTDMVDPNYVSSDTIDLIYSTAVSIPSAVLSLIEFKALCENIFNAELNQYRIYSFQNNPYARAQCQAAAESLYCDKTVKLDSLSDPDDPSIGMLYSVLLQQLGLDLSDYRPIDYFVMATGIYDAATGSSSIALLDPSNIQKSMINILTHLSSYSIQVVTSGMSSEVITVPRPEVRINNVINNEILEYRIDEEFIRITNTTSQESQFNFITYGKMINEQSNRVKESIFVDLQMNANNQNRYSAGTYSEGILKTNVRVHSTFDQQALFNSLTSVQKQSVVDVYRKN